MKIARYYDSAVLKPDMKEEDVIKAIQLSIDLDSYTVCVRPCDIELAVKMCEGTDTKVSCVLDFPHGDAPAEAKAALAGIYAAKGVYEIDMVLNFGYVRSGKWDEVRKGIHGVVEASAAYGVGVKVIFETCYLTEEEIKKATAICVKEGAKFVKTSTGFGTCGATPEAVQAMLEAADGKIEVKASGGIRNYADARGYVDMGATRLGVGYSSIEKICREESEAE